MRCAICDILLQPSRKLDICLTCSHEISKVHTDDDWESEIAEIVKGYASDD